MTEKLQIRIHGDGSLPTLVYLPGLHGDWTLVGSFRAAMADHARFVEFTYPRTLEWSLEDYANGIRAALVKNGITEGWLLGESFGSQIVWTLAERSRLSRGKHGTESNSFRIEGIVLTNGF